MNGPGKLAEAASARLREARRLHALHDLDGALREYRAAESLSPGHPEILEGFAQLASDAGDWSAAERVLRLLESRDPGHYTAPLALALLQLDRPSEALPMLEALVRRGDTDIACIIAYSACLERTGNTGGAIEILEQLYRAMPTAENAVLLNALLMRTGSHEAVARRLPELVAAHPDEPRLLSAQSEDALSRGDYARGFDLLRYRWSIAREERKSARLACPEWDGTPFEGTLLVTCEQGLGEEILTSHSFGELAALRQRCLIDAEPRLLPVFRRSFPSLDFASRHDETLVDASRTGKCRKIEALELFRFFRRDASLFPARAGWLLADMRRRASLRERLQTQHPGKRLAGLSWRSSHALSGDAKSIPLQDLSPLLGLTDTVFVDLQYGDTAADRAGLEKSTGLRLAHLPDIDLTNDLDSLFSLVATLDVVVTSSNTTAHIAGALGRPVYTLIPGARYVFWYWGYEGAKTPWYPTMQLFRGPPRKPWPELAADVAGALTREIPPP